MWYVSHAAADRASPQSPPLGVQLYSVRDDNARKAGLKKWKAEAAKDKPDRKDK